MTRAPFSFSVHLLDQGGSRRQSWALRGKATYRIGRGPDNDLVLPFSWVSRKHAMIQVEANGICNLIDLGSANGTFVNGRRVYAPMPLRTGDRLEIGRTRLEFEQAAKAPAAAPVEENLDDRTVAFVEKEMVTILICDLHDYTKLTRQLGPQAISALLRQWTALAARLIETHGGILDKFIGDAALAIWRNGDRPETIRKVLAAALAIAEATGGLQAGEGLPPLAIGAAVNTGEAMLGNMGVDGHRDFTVIGDAVNMAFRLEELTSREQELDLLIGASTVADLPGADRSCRLLSCRVKGREEPVPAYACSFAGLRAYLQERGDRT
ncbi:MAG: adenylate/guanylate cyclase domain-containing protein [Desulfobacteraceae bacterium]|nr:adenylate/guanylate cyclase domain-containing protein [Desulfobacteraceae bacterium]